MSRRVATIVSGLWIVYSIWLLGSRVWTSRSCGGEGRLLICMVRGASLLGELERYSNVVLINAPFVHGTFPQFEMRMLYSGLFNFEHGKSYWCQLYRQSFDNHLRNLSRIVLILEARTSFLGNAYLFASIFSVAKKFLLRVPGFRRPT